MREKDRDLRRRRQRRLERLRQRNQEEVAKRKTARTEGSKRALKPNEKEADAAAAGTEKKAAKKPASQEGRPGRGRRLDWLRWLDGLRFRREEGAQGTGEEARRQEGRRVHPGDDSGDGRQLSLAPRCASRSVPITPATS